jgi:hypothetical protein
VRRSRIASAASHEDPPGPPTASLSLRDINRVASLAGVPILGSWDDVVPLGELNRRFPQERFRLSGDGRRRLEPSPANVCPGTATLV